MWAFRSFLRRPSPLVTSRLQSIRHHDATHAAGLGRNLIPASRRRFSNEATTGDLHQPAAAAKRHLYLVLDDQKKDYGIYKLDVDADLLDGDVGSDCPMAPRPLPHPALIRVEVTEDESSAQFAAAGGCIVATGCSPFQSLIYSGDCGIVTILYNIKTAAMSFSIHPTDTLDGGYAVAVPVGNKLYVLDLHTSSVDSFHVMTTSKDDDADWSWYSGSGSSRIGWTYGGKARSSSQQLPFYPDEIQAHAVHPHDCTIFVSSLVRHEHRYEEGWRDGDTFAYDTTGDRRRYWKSCGRWTLPFKGHGQYDRQMNRWVGLQVDETGDGTTGYLSACDIPSSDHKDCPPEPERTSSMEKILLDDPDGRRLDVKLVYMDGKYCVVERLGHPGAAEKNECLGDGEECVLRLTTFRLKYEYGEPGYLRILDRRVRSYKVSRYRDYFEAQAFWI